MKHLETMRLIARTQRRRAEAAEARVAELEVEVEQERLAAAEQDEDLPGPFAWWLYGSREIFLASEFTPDTEHRDEWVPLYR